MTRRDPDVVGQVELTAMTTNSPVAYQRSDCMRTHQRAASSASLVTVFQLRIVAGDGASFDASAVGSLERPTPLGQCRYTSRRPIANSSGSKRARSNVS